MQHTSLAVLNTIYDSLLYTDDTRKLADGFIVFLREHTQQAPIQVFHFSKQTFLSNKQVFTFLSHQ